MLTGPPPKFHGTRDILGESWGNCTVGHMRVQDCVGSAMNCAPVLHCSVLNCAENWPVPSEVS